MACCAGVFHDVPMVLRVQIHKTVGLLCYQPFVEAKTERSNKCYSNSLLGSAVCFPDWEKYVNRDNKKIPTSV